MSRSPHADVWTLRPLTRTRRSDGAVYRREATVDAQIGALCRRSDRARRAELTRDSAHGDADRLQEETLVYGLREYAARGDMDTAWAIAETLTARVTRHIARQLAKWRLSPEDADDCTRDLFAALYDALFDTSEAAEFWEVRFWVCLDRRLWNLIEKRQGAADAVLSESGESADGDELESRLLRIADDGARPDVLLERQAALALLTDNERMAVYLKCIEGLPEESDDPERVTVAKLLGVTGRSVRNYLRRAEAKLIGWQQQ